MADTPTFGGHRRGTVLLVEDDRCISETLVAALKDDGIDVEPAQNGQEAIALLQGGLRPSVIVLDLMMPVMDGWDFRQAQLLDSELGAIPVVVITAAGFSAETVRLQLGDVELVRKPIDYVELLRSIEQFCQAA